MFLDFSLGELLEFHNSQRQARRLKALDIDIDVSSIFTCLTGKIIHERCNTIMY